MHLNVGTMLTSFAIDEDTAHHDSKRADALCAGLKDGDVLLANRAYLDLEFLHSLQQSGVFLVLREKDNMVFCVVKSRRHEDTSIIADETVRMSRSNSSEKDPRLLRRVTTIVEVDDQDVVMSFITKNFVWSPCTIAEL